MGSEKLKIERSLYLDKYSKTNSGDETISFFVIKKFRYNLRICIKYELEKLYLSILDEVSRKEPSLATLTFPTFQMVEK